MQFDDDQRMTKPENSPLICELEDKLKLDDYSYSHKQESAFTIDAIWQQFSDYPSVDLQVSPICCQSSYR